MGYLIALLIGLGAVTWLIQEAPLVAIGSAGALVAAAVWWWDRRRPRTLQLADLTPLDLSDDEWEVGVVGESHYQEALERLAGGRTASGPAKPEAVATLVPEPSNRQDANAVMILLGGETVGYLSRDDAAEFSPELLRLARQGRIGTARATIKGGWDRGADQRGSFGVVLHLAPPEEWPRAS
jgi:hypothetical protein